MKHDISVLKSVVAEHSEFIKKLWDNDKNDFNYEIINEYNSYIERNSNRTIIH